MPVIEMERHLISAAISLFAYGTAYGAGCGAEQALAIALSLGYQGAPGQPLIEWLMMRQQVGA